MFSEKLTPFKPPTRPEPLTRPVPSTAPAAKRPVIAVISAKGGAGATTAAINLASAIARNGRTTLIDANLQAPSISELCGVEVIHSLIEILANGSAVDEHVLDACLTASDCQNLHLLCPPISGEAGVRFTLTGLTKCMQGLNAHSDFWVVDVPTHLDRNLVTLLDYADKILLVFEANITGIGAVRRWLSTFEELGYESDKIVLVQNRSGSKFKTIEQHLSSCFQNKKIWQLPNISLLAFESANQGKSVYKQYPAHAYTKVVSSLSEHLLAAIKSKEANRYV